MSRTSDDIGQPPLGTLLWILVLLTPLVSPAMTITEVAAGWLAAVGLAGFVMLYVTVVWTAFCWPPPRTTAGAPPRPPKARLIALSALTALGLALAANFGGDEGSWLIVLLYVGVAGGATLSDRTWAKRWLTGTILVLVAIGTARGATAGAIVSTALSTALAGVVVIMFRRMTELIDHLRRTQAELADAAVREERLRFSRDLHDLLGHTLSLIVVKAELLRRSITRDPDAAIKEAGEIEDVGRQALTDVRGAVTGYRDLSLAEELDSGRATLSGVGIDVNIRASGTPLPQRADSLFGWVLREAVTNVVRHSDAGRCDIVVTYADTTATLEMRDDGQNAQPAPLGSGLQGVSERVSAAGGDMDAGPTPHGGWRVAVTIPIGAGSS